ncbi:MAG: hypothetical protein ACLFTR_02905 [Candidatus Woesearchaeota archaeon]
MKLGDRSRNKHISHGLLIISILALSFFAIVTSVAVNVYLHELGHYFAASYYDLDPEMHISNVVEMGSGGIRMNIEPEAYVKYTDSGDTLNNLLITLAGPSVNIMLFLLFMTFQITMHRRLSRKARLAERYGNQQSEKRFIRLCMLSDILLFSLAVPSLLSAVMNMSGTPGSDGEYFRELMRQL